LAWMCDLSSMENVLSIIEDDAASRRTGLAVKRRREAAGLSLRELAGRSGVSASMISDIERGAKSPTVATLVRLASALGVGAAVLLEDAAAAVRRIHVIRAGEGERGDGGSAWEKLGPAGPGSRIEFVRHVIPAGAVLGPAPAHAAGTVEHMHVVRGQVRVTVGDEVAEMAAGDSCSCLTDVPHGVANPGKGEAEVYVVLERR
jgi:transcriptional regulator with XRE-family HTH domain